MGIIGGRTVKTGVGTVGGFAAKRRSAKQTAQTDLDRYILHLRASVAALEGERQLHEAVILKERLSAAERTARGIKEWRT
jgi:hypothetical protein